MDFALYERRLLSFGWSPDGKLWVASRLPYSIFGFVLGIPGGVKRFLADRKFEAFDKAQGTSCGQVSINEAGLSFGYAPFLRMAGADPGDVLLSEFDLASEKVELSIVDEVILDTDFPTE